VDSARIIAFPAGANVTDAVPLLFLSAASSLNPDGVDIVVASRAACIAFAGVAGGPQCDPGRLFSAAEGWYTYLGTAAALAMAPVPGCAS
jgi:hypothetical protein